MKMKIKGVINNLIFLSNISKKISRNISGAVAGSVGSVQCRIVPCSSLYLFVRPVGPLPMHSQY